MSVIGLGKYTPGARTHAYECEKPEGKYVAEQEWLAYLN